MASLAPGVLDAVVEQASREAASILRERMTRALVEEVERLVASRRPEDTTPQVCDLRAAPTSESGASAGWYVYGISWASAPLTVLEGVDGGRIERVVVDDLAAIVSSIEPRCQWGVGADGNVDLDAIAPRAHEHARVLETMLENGAVIPFRFGVMYPGLRDVKCFLREDGAALRDTLRRVGHHSEWGLAIEWDGGPVAQPTTEAGDGRGYLAQRLEERTSKEDVVRRARRAALCVHDELALIASDSVVHPVSSTRRKGTEGRCPLLKASYLVRKDEVDDFRRAAESALTRADSELGLTGDLTGPWPPYNFSELVKEPVR